MERSLNHLLIHLVLRVLSYSAHYLYTSENSDETIQQQYYSISSERQCTVSVRSTDLQCQFTVPVHSASSQYQLQYQLMVYSVCACIMLIHDTAVSTTYILSSMTTAFGEAQFVLQPMTRYMTSADWLWHLILYHAVLLQYYDVWDSCSSTAVDVTMTSSYADAHTIKRHELQCVIALRSNSSSTAELAIAIQLRVHSATTVVGAVTAIHSDSNHYAVVAFSQQSFLNALRIMTSSSSSSSSHTQQLQKQQLDGPLMQVYRVRPSADTRSYTTSTSTKHQDRAHASNCLHDAAHHNTLCTAFNTNYTYMLLRSATVLLLLLRLFIVIAAAMRSEAEMVLKRRTD
eukprot:14743-Heterococcus_DN1.PRE.1